MEEDKGFSVHQGQIKPQTIKTRHLEEGIELTTPTITGGTITDATITDANIVTPTGDVVTLTGAQTLTDKTLTLPIISSISNSGTVTIPTGTVTLLAAGAWTAYVPTITCPGGTPPTYTANATGKYYQIGKSVFLTFAFTNAAGGTAGAGAVPIFFSLPVTAAQTEATDNLVPGGVAVVYNNAATTFTQTFVASTTTMCIRSQSTATLNGADQDQTVRQVYGCITYETA